MMRSRTHLRLGFACSAVFVPTVLTFLVTTASAEKTLEQTWREEHVELLEQIQRLTTADPKWRDRLVSQALDQQALVLPKDKDPLDVVLRRSTALVRHFNDQEMLSSSVLARFETLLEELTAKAQTTSQAEARERLFIQACRLRRSIAFANPLLNFDRIVCMLEQPGDRRMMEQARAVCAGHSKGGGPIIIEDIKSKAVHTSALTDIQVTSGPWKGKELTGKFSGLELSYNGKELLFAATTDADVWHIFRFDLVTKRLEQLTDGPDDDFDPHQLPSGRIVFTSTRRGGIGRCGLVPDSLTYTLYSMEPDGSDIVCISFHEGNEWAPTVSHTGKIVYTRWDYVDRHWGTAHHYWECLPDGRDPRSFHGNYPLPYSAMPEGVQPQHYGRPTLVFGRLLRPDGEQSFRPVPGSQKYTATAVGHHTGFSGSLVLLDTRIADDGQMSQLKRITPEYFFPEVEHGAVQIFDKSWPHIERIMPADYGYPRTRHARAQHTFGTAWALSEDFYLCNFDYGLYLLDRFGNRDVIYDPGRGAYRVRDPFPLRPREMPPDLPPKTWQGERMASSEHRRAVISVMNVYHSDEVGQLPEGVKVKWMRIVQAIPQLLTDPINVTLVSHANDSIGRMPPGRRPRGRGRQRVL